MPVPRTRILAAVDLAIDNVIIEGLSDIFPRCFEEEHLKDNKVREKVRTSVVTTITNSLSQRKIGPLEVHPIAHVLFPKRQTFEYRRAALIEPVDTIKYLSIVLLAADQIESHRVSTNRNILHSYRYAPSAGRLFDPRWNYSSFKDAVNRKALDSQAKVAVRTDISAFYDRVNLHRLESVLHAASVDPQIVATINELLITWSNRDSFGLPVGSNASRILAEAALSDVDEYLLSNDVRFVRFVDDFVLFANSAREAHFALSLLVHALSLQGLHLAAKKTRLMDVEEIRSEFLHEADQREDEEKSLDLWTVSDSGTGYSGTLPTIWNTLTPAQIVTLDSKSPDERFQEISAKNIAHQSEIRDYINSVAHRFAYEHFGNLPQISENCPELTPFLVDMLIKNGDRIEPNVRNKVADGFEKILGSPRFTPEYVLLAAVRLLSDENFARPNTLFRFVRNSLRNSGHFASRAALLGLEGKVTHSQALEIRTWFERASQWERRAIVRVVDAALSESERRPWHKNIRTFLSNDVLMAAVID
jgi:hypothetical protein